MSSFSQDGRTPTCFPPAGSCLLRIWERVVAEICFRVLDSNVGRPRRQTMHLSFLALEAMRRTPLTSAKRRSMPFGKFYRFIEQPDLTLASNLADLTPSATKVGDRQREARFHPVQSIVSHFASESSQFSIFPSGHTIATGSVVWQAGFSRNTGPTAKCCAVALACACSYHSSRLHSSKDITIPDRADQSTPHGGIANKVAIQHQLHSEAGVGAMRKQLWAA